MPFPSQVLTRTHRLGAFLSRRGLVRLAGGLGLLGGALAPLGSREIAAKRRKGKKKGKKPKKLATPSPSAPPTPPLPLELAYECAGPTDFAVSISSGTVVSQRFVAMRSGTLRQIKIRITKDPGIGDFVVQLLAVTGSPNGTPWIHPVGVLALDTIPDAAVPAGETTITGNFAGPQLVQGTEYAATVSRRGASYTPHSHVGCEGAVFTGESENTLGLDLIVSVLVS
jgi:hypothetical protein